MDRLYVVIVICFVYAGCASPRIDLDAETRAQRHMLLADTLERAGEFPQALLEYGLVTELYPKTSHYPLAVRKIVFLYANPGTTVANDSVAFLWLNTYRQLSLPATERQMVDLLQVLMTQLRTVRRELTQETLVADSLAFVTRRQGGDLTTKARRIQELEQQLQQATNELTKLKEVDVHISRSREKK